MKVSEKIKATREKVEGVIFEYAEAVDFLHLMENLRKLFDFLKSIVSKNSIVQKLEDVEAQLQENIKNDVYTQEQLKHLSETVDSLAGKLRNTTPEAMQETAEKAAQELDALVAKMYSENRLITDINEEDFFTAMKNISGHSDMSNKEFREYFEKNAALYDNGDMKLEKGQVEGKTSMLIKIDNKCYQATFDVSEAKPTGNDPDIKKRKCTLTINNFEGSYSKAKEIVPNPNVDKHETMMRKFILPRGLHREEDMRRIDFAELAKNSTVLRDIRTIEKFSSKVNVSEDGRYEFFYDKNSNTYRARDKETKEMFVFYMNKGNINGRIVENVDDVCSPLQNLNLSGKDKNVIFFDYMKGTGLIRYRHKDISDSQMALFRCKENMEFLETKGVPTKELRTSLEVSDTKDRRGYSKVDREGLANVDIMYRALYETIASDENSFETKAIHDSRKFGKGSRSGAVYLSVSDKAGNTMSVSFNQDGTPRDINYKQKGGKFHLAQNLDMRGNYGSNYEYIRYDESFSKLFDTFKTAYNLYQNRTEHIQKEYFAAKNVNEVSEKLLVSVLNHMKIYGKDAENLTGKEEFVGITVGEKEREAIKAILIDYSIDANIAEKLTSGKSQKLFDKMKSDLTKVLEKLSEKENVSFENTVKEQETPAPESVKSDDVQNSENTFINEEKTESADVDTDIDADANDKNNDINI